MLSIKKSALLLLSIIYSTNIFSGLLPETIIYMGNYMGNKTYVRAKNLKVDCQIPIYDVSTHKFKAKKKKVENVTINKTKTIIILETENDDRITVGPEQKLYNRRIKKCIEAKEFKIGDTLFSPEKGNLEIINIEIQELDSKIELYEFSIEDGNLFLILTNKNTHILIHNFAFVTLYLGAAFGGKLLAAAKTAAVISTVTSFMIYNYKHRRFNRFLEEVKDNPDLKDIIKDAKKIKKRKGKSEVFDKNGGAPQKNEDFDKLNKGNVEFQNTAKGHIKFGITRNGERIVDRNFSGDRSKNKSTLEIQRGKHDYVKIRYND